MFGKLLKFELSFHLRQVGFWITALVMVCIGLLATTEFLQISMEGGAKIKTNGAIPLALSISALSMGAIFFGAIFVVNGVMRDDTFKSLEIIHATPVKTPAMILSRLCGAWIVTSLALCSAVLGLMLGQFMPWADAASFGPFNALYFIQPVMIFVLINALLVSGIYTAFAVTTRNRALVYVSAVGLFVFYFSASLLAGEDAPDLIQSLIDPFGSSALAVTAEFWPAAEQNTVLTPLMGYVGLNRVVWGSIGIALFALGYIFSRRGLVTRKTKRGQAEIMTAPTDAIVLKPVTPDLSSRNTRTAFWARFKFEYLTTVRSVAFLILIGIALALFGLVAFVNLTLSPDPSLPTSNLILQIVLGSLSIPMIIIMIFFGGDIIWRDRAAGFHEILDATPVKNGVLLSSKWLALQAVIATIILIGIAFGMALQFFVSGGEIPININTYLTIAFLNFFILFFFQAILVMFVQNFAPNRVMGMLIATGVLAALAFGLSRLPFYHPLINYGDANAGSYSEMSGFRSLTEFGWFLAYWMGFVLVMAALSTWIFRRGLQSKLWQRMKGFRAHISAQSLGVAVLGLAAILVTGGTIYKSYNIDNDYRNRKANERRTATYERLVKPLEDAPTPKTLAVDVNVQFYPSKREAIVSGSFILENTKDAPIEVVYINSPVAHMEDVRRLDLRGAVRETDTDLANDLAEYDVLVYRFDPPLLPNTKTELSFEHFYHAPRLGDGSSILKNGTFVDSGAVMPQMGIQPNYLTNPDQRRKNDLPEREKMPERTDADGISKGFFDANADYVAFKATVCTDANQIPIAPGELLRVYAGETKDRTCRDYEAINPIANFYAFLSGEYTVKEDIWNNPNGDDVDLRIFYHETHDYNVDLMIEASKSSFDTFTALYGPYQHKQLRIMEFPFRSFAQSFAGTVPFSENIGFVMDPGDPDDIESIDIATYVTMHEIGHQWFGHQILPAQVKGFNVLSEGLTENAAMTAYEAKYGWQKARRILEVRSINHPLRGYLTARVQDKDAEPPLGQAENQSYLVYSKANWVFWGLKQYMGEDNMQRAIRNFIRDFGYKGAPYPTTLNLIEYLKAEADPDYHQLIDDYFEHITFWELKLQDGVAAKPNSKGGYTVSLTMDVDKKYASEADGKETSVTEIDGEALDEWIEIGFYQTDPKKTLGDEWTDLKRVRVTDLQSTVTFDLAERPNYVQLDPRRLLIERNVGDNGKELPKQIAATN
ncbi:M1 family aminopeptidase [Litorimonas sp. RW-G-Af-16]|uniref:ABC transporter permease/M1 family aminopeptidase n=1 Tax=Litorimonas sp. RW-G-Af-16 TaxID=3241168 RepID=UPI003AAC17AA